MSYLLATGFEIVQGVIYAAGLIAAGVGYYLTSRKLGKKTSVSLAETDYTLSNTSTQGAFIPLLIGRRRVGASVIAWVGDRKTRQEFQRVRSGGKGGRKRRTRHPPTGNLIYSESAWHQICVGPAVALYNIWSDGKIVMSTKITPGSHPSGSLIPAILDNAGRGYIYWGEPDQPINTILGDSSRVGVASRWPSVCYIHWEDLDIGTSPRWPQFEFEVEVDPVIENTDILTGEAFTPLVTTSGLDRGANLGYTLAQIIYEQYPHGGGCALGEWDFTAGTTGGPGTPEGTHNVHADVASTADGVQVVAEEHATGVVLTAGTYDLDPFSPPYYDGGGSAPGTNYLLIELFYNDHTGDISALRMYLKGPSGQEITLFEDNTLGVLYNGDTTFPATYTPPAGWVIGGFLGPDWIERDTELDVTQVVIDETGTWKLNLDYTTEFTAAPDNQLRMEAGVTFTPVASLPPSGSVYEAMELAAAESLMGSTIASDGEQADSVVGTILQDMGMFVTRRCNGKLGYVSTRRADDTDVVWLTEDQMIDPDFEIVALQDDRFVDRIMYTFHDVNRNYRQTVVQIDEDGQALLSGNVRGQVVPISNVVLFDPASTIAERRSQEELAASRVVSFEVARGGHRLYPGLVIRIPEFQYHLRVLEVSPRDDTGVCRVEAMVDTIGVEITGYVPPYSNPTNNPSLVPEVPLQERTFEVPEAEGTPGTPLVGTLRIRANPQVATHAIHLSADNVTYTLVASEGVFQTGGTLTSALVESNGWEIEEGPTFDLVGTQDDFLDVVEDLSANEPDWRSGLQLAAIGDELFFVRQVTPLGGISYRLDGLIRARYNTIRETHAIGAEVFIFDTGALNGISDPLLYPGALLYTKQQPITNVALDLTSVVPTSQTLHGKGVTPLRPSAFRTILPAKNVPAYNVGDDVEFSWSHSSTVVPGTGAGSIPAGPAVGSSPVPLGSIFEIEIYDSGMSLVATYTLSTNFIFTYTQAQRLTDLGGELDFTASLRMINGGWRSFAQTLDIEAL